MCSGGACPTCQTEAIGDVTPSFPLSFALQWHSVYLVRGRWLGPPKICGSGKHILNSEAIGKVWSLVVSRPIPHPSLTAQYITGGSFTVFTRNQKPDLNWSMPMSGCWEQPGSGNNFNENAITKAYKAVSKLCWMTLKGQGNKPWIQGCS